MDSLVVVGSSKIYIFKSDGISWTALDTGIPSSQCWALASSGSKLVAGTTWGVFFFTKESDKWKMTGSSLWVVCNAGLANTFRCIHALCIDGSFCYAATDSGVFVSDMEKNWRRLDSGLEGKKVRALVSGRLDRGTYKTVWNASPFSAGIYICTLEKDGFMQTRKLVLVK
jgi:hypothetical protein